MELTRWLRRSLALAGIGAIGSAVVVTARYSVQTPQPLRSGLEGVAKIDRAHGGDLYYTLAGPTTAHPLVLLHGFYPGASSYEYAGVVPRLTTDFRIYAPDWLGFGMSEHPALAYTGELYANILNGFLRDVVGQPALVVAGGGAANVAARAASDDPALFDRLVFVSPRVEAGRRLDPTFPQVLVRLAERLSLGLVPYAFLTTRPALRLMATRRGLGAASEDILDHEYAAAHQFGAQHAALAALDGELDLPLAHLLPTLEPPVLLIAGELDAGHPREEMEELAVLHPYTDLDIIPGSGCAVCQDQAVRFTHALTSWTQRALPRHVSTDTLRVGSPEATTVGASRPAPPVSSRRQRSMRVASVANGLLDSSPDEAASQRPTRPTRSRASTQESDSTPDDPPVLNLATRRAPRRQARAAKDVEAHDAQAPESTPRDARKSASTRADTGGVRGSAASEPGEGGRAGRGGRRAGPTR